MSSYPPERPAVSAIDYANPNSLGSRLRAKRIEPLLELIRDAHARYDHVRLLDLGGRKTYWNILPPGFLRHQNVSITVLNVPGEFQASDDDVFSHVAGDACDLHQYSDGHFHIAHSNSVIEHVGGWHNVKRFAAECRRVASGLFVQTPYFWFPVEPHYVFPLFNWFPRPVQERLVQKFALGYSGRKAPDLDTAIDWIDAAPRLLDLRAYQLLFPDCRIEQERFLLLTKSMIAIRAVV
jgi:Methyltransferase domain